MPLSLKEVLSDHWRDFARRHVRRLANAHYRAVRAVRACRTPVLGGHLWKCPCCPDSKHYVYHSCNHRSCPECGSLDQQRWSAVQEARLLPGIPYFLVTLTVPDTLRGICRKHPAALYDLLLRESAAALKDVCLSKLGGLPGFTAVLHTWGRQMQHHPHVHLVVPGVMLSPERALRHPQREDFLIHGSPLATRFRNRLEIALKHHHPDIHAMLVADHPQAFAGRWVADVLHTGNGRPALRYLARYVFRSALGPKRLLGYDAQGRIRLLCHESGTNRAHTISLRPEVFLKRWLTHVLPTGFVRVRHYGWMSGAARKSRLLVRALVCGQLDEPQPILPASPVPQCERCGATMILLLRIEPRGPPKR